MPIFAAPKPLWTINLAGITVMPSRFIQHDDRYSLNTFDPMKPKDAFGVAVRVVGLSVGLVGVYFLTCALVIFVYPQYNPKVGPGWHFLLFGLIGLLGGLCLIRGVRYIVRFAYPGDDSDSPPKPPA